MDIRRVAICGAGSIPTFAYYHQSLRLGDGDVLRDQRRMLRCHSHRRELETAQPRQTILRPRSTSRFHGTDDDRFWHGPTFRGGAAFRLLLGVQRN
jgi:hypothetical protein